MAYEYAIAEKVRMTPLNWRARYEYRPRGPRASYNRTLLRFNRMDKDPFKTYRIIRLKK